MALNVSEEQKKFIESQGYMVIEFKLWCRKLSKMFLEYAVKVIACSCNNPIIARTGN